MDIEPVTPEDMRAYFLQVSPDIQVEFMKRALDGIRAAGPPAPEEQGGVDWRDVPADTRLTAPQQAARFRTFTWAQQVAFMEGREKAIGQALECDQNNHRGALYYAMGHRCRNPYRRSRATRRMIGSKRRRVIKKGRRA